MTVVGLTNATKRKNPRQVASSDTTTGDGGNVGGKEKPIRFKKAKAISCKAPKIRKGLKNVSGKDYK